MASLTPKRIPSNLPVSFKDAAKSLKAMKKVDPATRYVLLFPNFDNVHIGMGLSLLNIPKAEAVFDQANKLLRYDLRKICLDGPKEKLCDDFVNRSLAAFVTSHATIEKFGFERPESIQFCKAAGGFGVGFINCLVFSKAMTFEDGLYLVRQQAMAMDKAAKIVPSAKLRVKLRPATRLNRVCQAAVEHCIKLDIPEEIAVCSMTKQLKPHLVEIAGHEEAIRYLETEGYNLFEFRKMAKVHDIPQAYHTKLMQPARDYLASYVEDKIKKNPDYLKEPETCSVYSSTSGFRLRSIRRIKKDLIDYPIQPILQEQLIQYLFRRPKSVSQPNTIVFWDKFLQKGILPINRLAHKHSKLYN